MPTPSCINAQPVPHPNATSHLGQRRRIHRNAQLQAANLICSWLDTSPSWIAQATTCSWLPCLPVPQSWTQLSFWLLAINRALSHKPLSIWLLLKSWSSNTLLSCRTKSTWLFVRQALLKDNTKISRSSFLVQSLKMPPSSPFPHKWSTMLMLS